VYRELLNTDAALYGGANRGNFGSVASEDVPAHGQPCSLELYLPPQTLLLLVPETLASEAAAPPLEPPAAAAPSDPA
jgi:hypothetical protein